MDIYERLGILPKKKRLAEYVGPMIKNFLKKYHVKPYGIGNVTDVFANVIWGTNWNKVYRNYHIQKNDYQKERYKRNWIHVYMVTGKRTASTFIGVDEIIYCLSEMGYTVTKDEKVKEPQLMTCTKNGYAINGKYIAEIPFVRSIDLVRLVQTDPQNESLKKIREQDVDYTCTLGPEPLPSREQVIKENLEKKKKREEGNRRNQTWKI